MGTLGGHWGTVEGTIWGPLGDVWGPLGGVWETLGDHWWIIPSGDFSIGIPLKVYWGIFGDVLDIWGTFGGQLGGQLRTLGDIGVQLRGVLKPSYKDFSLEGLLT